MAALFGIIFLNNKQFLNFQNIFKKIRTNNLKNIFSKNSQ